MVWQSGLVDFQTFFALAAPSVVNYLVPALIMSFFVSKEVPAIDDSAVITMKRGAKGIIFLFVCTVATAVSFHNFLHLPPFLGMMTGLAYLKIFGYYLKRTHIPESRGEANPGEIGDVQAFDSYRELARAEWDTLLFFFGVIMCVGGLGFIGYLSIVSQFLYLELGPTNSEHPGGLRLCHRRQYSGHGRGPADESGYGYKSVASRHSHRRRRRQLAVGRLRRRRRSNGPSPWHLHLLWPSEVDTCHLAGIRAQHLGPPDDQRSFRRDLSSRRIRRRCRSDDHRE